MYIYLINYIKNNNYMNFNPTFLATKYQTFYPY